MSSVSSDCDGIKMLYVLLLRCRYPCCAWFWFSCDREPILAFELCILICFRHLISAPIASRFCVEVIFQSHSLHAFDILGQHQTLGLLSDLCSGRVEHTCPGGCNSVFQPTLEGRDYCHNLPYVFKSSPVLNLPQEMVRSPCLERQ